MGNLLGPWERLLATLQSLSPASLAIRGQVRRLIVNILNTARTLSLLTVASSLYSMKAHTYKWPFTSPPHLKLGCLSTKTMTGQQISSKLPINEDLCGQVYQFLGDTFSFDPIVSTLLPDAPLSCRRSPPPRHPLCVCTISNKFLTVLELERPATAIHLYCIIIAQTHRTLHTGNSTMSCMENKCCGRICILCKKKSLLMSILVNGYIIPSYSYYLLLQLSHTLLFFGVFYEALFTISFTKCPGWVPLCSAAHITQ